MNGRFGLLMGVLAVLASANACTSVSRSSDYQQDRYSADAWLVVVRAEEVEIHGLLGARVVNVPSTAIKTLEEGAFEVDLERVREDLKGSGAMDLAELLKNRGVKKIVFDRVGDAALRARMDGDSDSALILNREQGRAPAGFGERDPSFMERYSPARF